MLRRKIKSNQTPVPKVAIRPGAARGVWKHPSGLAKLTTVDYDRLVKAGGRFALFAAKTGTPGFLQPMGKTAALAWSAESWTAGDRGVEIKVGRKRGLVVDAHGQPLMVGVDASKSIMLFKL